MRKNLKPAVTMLALLLMLAIGFSSCTSQKAGCKMSTGMVGYR